MRVSARVPSFVCGGWSGWYFGTVTENVTHALDPEEEEHRNEWKADAGLIHRQTAACFCPFDPSAKEQWQRGLQ